MKDRIAKCDYEISGYHWATMTVFFTLFDTAIGRCAIAWGARGVAGVQLPEANEPKTRARVPQRFPRAKEAAPPSELERARDSIVAYLRGEPGDLSSIPLEHGSRAGIPPPRLRGRA